MAILKWRITHGFESERPSAYWNLDWKVEIEEVKIGAVSKVGMTRTGVVLYGERKKVVRLAETGAHDITTFPEAVCRLPNTALYNIFSKVI